ncbi:hypothetical protein PPL_09349 [Heterostelium album PN500]|uniref:Uncharacterized protein n=1 Tax=Heterostelium pallidum (strain ATCC 26659 / Pp 5 / PN500) TaxID=670386 RepID=D3BLB7_HETP5|nr:hypothetical protein PPL_09349 [Heterostelium album PN500]EFA77851.1 hypothetical protein PPL_09349 [Heterostelium album PN500]|eukprot:XP_020429979.1 hypothetical protein PPL_09349 [Heterostelium album PN500]
MSSEGEDDVGVFDLFPPSEDIEIYKYNFGDLELSIRGQELQNQNIQPSTGLLPWPAASIMSSFIAKHNELFVDKNVLELGTGVGICGLIASRYARSVLLSDGDTATFDQLNKNIELNSHLYNVNGPSSSSLSQSKKPKAIKLRWGKDETLEQLKSDLCFQPYDIIIGSDLIYQDSSIEPLFYTVNQLLAETSDATFYLSFLDRKNHLPTVERVSKQFGFNLSYLFKQILSNNNKVILLKIVF